MIRLLLLVSVVTLPVAGQAIPVHSDPRIELLTVIFRLADADEYNQCQVPAYAAAIDTAFGKYRMHPTIELAKRIRDANGIGFDAVPEFALSLSAPPALAERVRYDSTAWQRQDPRWAGPQFREFARAVQQFARDTRFMEFYRRQAPVLDAAASSLRAMVREKIHAEWYTTFFGPVHNVSFVAIPGVCNGGANYGPHIALGSGRTEFYAVIGVSDTTPSGMPRVASGVAPIIVHEFAHSYANPLIGAHFTQMRQAADSIYGAVRQVMARQAYGDGRTMLNESLVRAAVVRYRSRYEGPAAAEAELREQFGRGFLWIRGLDSLLSRYEASRATYPTLAAFMPELVRFFHGVAATMPERIRELEAAQPHLVALTPADGAVVDAGTTSITLKFDRRMSGGYSLNQVGGKAFPELTTTTWNAQHDELTLGVRLKPGQQYGLSITGAGFQTAEGVPFAGTTWSFRTSNPANLRR